MTKKMLVCVLIGLVVGVVGSTIAKVLGGPGMWFGYFVGGLAGSCSAYAMQKMAATAAADAAAAGGDGGAGDG